MHHVDFEASVQCLVDQVSETITEHFRSRGMTLKLDETPFERSNLEQMARDTHFLGADQFPGT